MKNYVFIALLTFCSFSIHAQDKKTEKEKPTLEVVYDFETQRYTTYQQRPQHKKPMVLRITNINKIANIVEIVTNDVRIKDDFLDAEEKKVKTILEGDKPVEAIKADAISVDLSIPAKVLTENDKKTNPKTTEIRKLTNQIEAIDREISALKIKVERNDNAIDGHKNELLKNENDLNAELKSLDSTSTADQKAAITKKHNDLAQPIKDKVKALVDENVTLKKSIEDLKNDKKSKENELNQNNDDLRNFKMKASALVEKYTLFIKKIKDVNRINSAYNSYIDYIINPSLTHAQYNTDAKLICAILREEKRDDYQSDINLIDEKYGDFVESYNTLKNDNLFFEITKIDESYANFVKIQIENLKKDIDQVYKTINVTELRKKLNNVQIIDNVLSKEKAFVVVSNPIQGFEDYLEFKVKIKQNRELGTSIIKENNKEFTYVEYVRQGVRWDVSIGTVFDFGIKNQEYEVKKLDNDQFEIIENNSSKYTPTIAGILHTSFRSNSMFAMGLSLGVSINITDLNFNSFFPGVSLLIGKREKMVLTVGPAFKRVKQIKSIYENDRILDEEIQVTDITTDQFKIGYFFGITYNLTSNQRSKIKGLK